MRKRVSVAVMAAVMLYAYWPPGLYGFDNVSMKEVSPGATRAIRRIP